MRYTLLENAQGGVDVFELVETLTLAKGSTTPTTIAAIRRLMNLAFETGKRVEAFEHEQAHTCKHLPSKMEG